LGLRKVAGCPEFRRGFNRVQDDNTAQPVVQEAGVRGGGVFPVAGDAFCPGGIGPAGFLSPIKPGTPHRGSDDFWHRQHLIAFIQSFGKIGRLSARSRKPKSNPGSARVRLGSALSVQQAIFLSRDDRNTTNPQCHRSQSPRQVLGSTSDQAALIPYHNITNLHHPIVSPLRASLQWMGTGRTFPPPSLRGCYPLSAPLRD